MRICGFFSFFFTGQVCTLYAVWLLAAHVSVNALAKHKRHVPRHVASILLVQVVHSLHRHSVRLLLNLSVGGGEVRRLEEQKCVDGVAAVSITHLPRCTSN